ncbi:glycosyltransferase family 61 protein [Paracoccus lutimaris]|uniref:Uncharacterized protein DUF563 n=1 Tax=Paracoccus lutimaris TaxID=1490030 RepID=A0A368ZAG6_9RHOB|nr:glycosyltransferase family 61 protein [Paracoccus lutimaris]RCW88778.1 uncharacterized protein DUF563 [Paracoccus lutimaris]
MHSLRPITNRLARLVGGGRKEFLDTAVERWEISPAEKVEIIPGIWLPDQIEHVAQTEFGALSDIVACMLGDPQEPIAATMAYRLRDVDYIDGALYARGAEMHLRDGRHEGRRLSYPRPERSISGAIYESWIGNRWFGNWLLNDCMTYRLAETAGHPVTTAPLRGGHIARYEEVLGMTPERIGDVHFDELVLFDDLHNNASRQARASENRARLLAGRVCKPLPGVFIFRGTSGATRILENEAEIAERLEVEYGFRTLYIDRHSVDEIALAVGGTDLVVGVEGSQLAHGVIAMRAGGALLTIQPPDRVTSALKLLTDCWRQHFAMVVGHGTIGGFRLEWDDLRRTLDLIAARNPQNPS